MPIVEVKITWVITKGLIFIAEVIIGTIYSLFLWCADFSPVDLRIQLNCYVFSLLGNTISFPQIVVSMCDPTSSFMAIVSSICLFSLFLKYN